MASFEDMNFYFHNQHLVMMTHSAEYVTKVAAATVAVSSRADPVGGCKNDKDNGNLKGDWKCFQSPLGDLCRERDGAK